MNEEELNQYAKISREIEDRYFSLEEICSVNPLLKYMEYGCGRFDLTCDSGLVEEMIERFGKGFPEIEEIRKKRMVSQIEYDNALAFFALMNYSSALKKEITLIQDAILEKEWGVKI